MNLKRAEIHLSFTVTICTGIATDTHSCSALAARTFALCPSTAVIAASLTMTSTGACPATALRAVTVAVVATVEVATAVIGPTVVATAIQLMDGSHRAGVLGVELVLAFLGGGARDAGSTHVERLSLQAVAVDLLDAAVVWVVGDVQDTRAGARQSRTQVDAVGVLAVGLGVQQRALQLGVYGP